MQAKQKEMQIIIMQKKKIEEGIIKSLKDGWICIFI